MIRALEITLPASNYMMSLSILFDLDDTLLEVNLGRFIQAYFESFTQHVAYYGVGEDFMRILWEGTQKMFQNIDPALTLETVFASYFYPAINSILPSHLRPTSSNNNKPHPINPILNEFYEKEFPKLQTVTQKRSEATNLITHFLSCGYPIAIATNPLFPKTATHQRLCWAGIPPDKFDFSVISTYEDFHFTKPHLEYYAEVLAQMGWQTDAVLMVGNDIIDDIEAAQSLGLAAFWIKPNGKSISRHPNINQTTTPTGSGDLKDLLPWLKTLKEEQLHFSTKTPAAAKAILRSTAAALDTFKKKSTAERWVLHSIPSEWSAIEVLCHLRDVEEEVYQPRILQILQVSNPYFPDIDVSGWSVERKYQQQHLEHCLHRFIQLRKQTLLILEELDNDAWLRKARHETAGDIDLATLICRIATHDIQHIRQIYEQLH